MAEEGAGIFAVIGLIIAATYILALYPAYLLFFVETDVACVGEESGILIDVAQRFNLVLTIQFASIMSMAISFGVLQCTNTENGRILPLIYLASILAHIIGAYLNWIYRLFSDAAQACAATVLIERGFYLKIIGICYLIVLIITFVSLLVFLSVYGVWRFKEWQLKRKNRDDEY